MTTDPELIEPFHWFGKASIEKLRAQLSRSDAERLEVRGHGEHMTLTVIYAADAQGDRFPSDDPVNESFPCPPRCP